MSSAWSITSFFRRSNKTTGLGSVTNVGLHYVVPSLFIVDWLLFTGKHPLSYATIPYWLLYPLVYGLVVVTRGAITGFYPYPFLDLDDLGVLRTSINVLGFGVIYALGAALFIAIGRRQPASVGDGSSV